VLNWQLKTFSEIQTMNRYSKDVIIVGMYLNPVQYVILFFFFFFSIPDIFGLYIDCYFSGISENQQLVICNELGGKRVSNLNSAYL
jgi:hypothetical protein